ncbi:MAG: glycoside hydrolase family 125 protein [Clostridia bacterium]|nr:glycoside hydrolase family 125 protein [Clostridia bacterium]
MKQLSEVLNRRLAPYIDAAKGSKVDGELLRGCFLSTCDTTLTPTENGGLFVITGDIPAMWLRDSSAQLLHYVRFADEETVADAIKRLLATQAELINVDPYANSFNITANGNHSKHYVDTPAPGDRVWERKYELDSLCWPLYLASRYYEKTSDLSFANDDYLKALRTITDLCITETRHENSDYMFLRSGSSDTLDAGGHGGPVGYTGMIWSAFRPSDDRCKLHYPIYSNLFALKSLGFAAKVFELKDDEEYRQKCLDLIKGVKDGIEKYGIIDHPRFGRMYAYETDGLGNFVLMDDANMPSLLALPVLGICDKDDEIYRNTRAFVLSRENPYYYEGRYAKGVGSPHTPEEYIWHMALCARMMTADSAAEREEMLDMLISTHAGTKRMHESFDPNDPSRFTRAWFAWADSVFADSVCTLIEQNLLPSQR